MSVATGSVTLSLLWLSLLLAWTAPAAAQGMALPGKFAVSPTGAATYSIGIAVPPGSAGMVPSLSIAYNSQARNGLLGMGWHLEGLPSIGRCPRTIAQDGVRGSVNYDANDRFCLDGQRLIAISGTYGADGTEYRTEIESFSKIISRGTAGNGPAWFEVWTKSGQRMEFGNTTDSRVLAQGKTTARDWVVNKVSDTKGNYFTVTYVNDTTNGQVYPDRIDYTGNAGAGLSPYNSVQFVYNTARPDVVPAYHLGSLQKTTVLLTKVQTFAGSTMVADYRLAYDQSSTTGRSRVTSVTLCTGAGACLPATALALQSGTFGLSITSNVAGLDGSLDEFRSYLGDFNGDGKTDILWDNAKMDGRSAGAKRYLWIGNGDGTFTIVNNPAGADNTLNEWKPYLADFNGDGRTDILWDHVYASGHRSRTKRILWLTKADGTFTIITNVAGKDGTLDEYLPHLGDFNGDGKTDILWDLTDQYGRSNSGKRFLWISKGDGTFSIITNPAGADNTLDEWRPFLADFNGDGKTDILWDRVYMDGRSAGLTRRLWIGNGDGTFSIITNPAGADNTLDEYVPALSDFNGDGKTDILWDRVSYKNGRSQGKQRFLWMGKGDGTFSIISNVAGSGQHARIFPSSSRRFQR